MPSESNSWQKDVSRAYALLRFTLGLNDPRMRLVLATVCALFLGISAFAETPAVGAKAPDFTLSTPTGKAVKMSKEEGGHTLISIHQDASTVQDSSCQTRHNLLLSPSDVLALAKDLDPDSELFRKDVDHLNLRLRDE
jgi:hypothetical protein